jgi:tRNA (guanine37-N1)-methyltransferase
MFPELFHGFVETSLIGKARQNGLISIELIDLRRFAHDKHRSLDDAPYGGGAGMVMLPEPIFNMLDGQTAAHRVLLTPKGAPFTQNAARTLLERSPLLLFCGRYEGVDQRARESFDEEISLGDFVLNGGEVAAMAVVETVSRLVPGVVGNFDSTVEESFSDGLLEYPQYTRPEVLRGRSVPAILLSGDHGRIARWRRAQSLLRTWRRRPELLAALPLTPEDRKLLDEAVAESAPDRKERDCDDDA